MTHTDIINSLITRYGYKSYLEIGLDTGANFRRINLDNKYSVDPYYHDNNDTIRSDSQIPDCLTWRMTSDEMFETVAKDMSFDIVFIDWMHTEEQVAKDIVNSLKHLNKGGKIVVHDCLPASYEAQLVPRIQGEWNGDVWKAVAMLPELSIDFSVVDTDYGCGVIEWFDGSEKLTKIPKCHMTYHEMVSDRNNVMHVIDENMFVEKYLK